jgi:hypothetical protein
MIINQIQNPGEIRLYTAGLRYQTWTDAYYADPAAIAASGGDPDIEGVFTSIASVGISETDAVIWRGYFLPDQDSTTWQFRTNSDDASFLWVNREDTGEPRNAAQQTNANMVNADATVDNGGVHVAQTRTSGNIELNAGIYYPICIFAANNSGPGTITVEFRRDSGTWQSNGVGFYFYDAGTDDGYHID